MRTDPRRVRESFRGYGSILNQGAFVCHGSLTALKKSGGAKVLSANPSCSLSRSATSVLILARLWSNLGLRRFAESISWRLERCGSRRQNHYVQPAVLGPAVGRSIAGDRMELPVTRGREMAWRKPIPGDQDLNELRCTRRGQLPVRGKLRGVNRNIV